MYNRVQTELFFLGGGEEKSDSLQFMNFQHISYHLNWRVNYCCWYAS